MKICVLVTDLFFKAKILQTAKLVEREVFFAESLDEVSEVDLVIMDLEKFGANTVLQLKKQWPNAKIVGYLSHIQVDLKKKALKNGCNLVLVKSDFSKQLKDLLIV